MCNDIRPGAFPCQAENLPGGRSAFALARRCKADYDKTTYVTYIIFSGAVVELTYKWIALANRHYLMYLNKRLASYGLSGSQYLFILNICRQPGLTQDKLPDIIHINKSNVTRALAHLEKRGFIRREVNPQDKRTAAVFPTQKALDVYPHVLEIIRGWDASVTSPLTEDEKHTLQGLLKRVVASAHEYRSTEA